MKTAITADFLKKLPPPPCDIWDVRQRGLVLRVRGSGTASWCVQYGRAKRLTLGRVDDLSPAQARALAAATFGDVARGKDPQLERRKRRGATLGDFLKGDFAKWAAGNHRSGGAETLQRIAGVFGKFLETPLANLTGFALETWRTERRRAGVADSTLNRDLAALRGVLSRAVAWRLLASHPMRDVKAATIDIFGRTRYLSADEERRLRAALDARDAAVREARRDVTAWRTARGYAPLPAPSAAYADPLHPLVLLALNTGLRRGELFALRWNDVDVIAARLTVRGLSAKSGLTRHVPLNTEALAVLHAWRDGRETSSTALVFPGGGDRPLTTIDRAWTTVAKAAQLSQFRFHDLRHSFASRLVQESVDLNTVRQLLGHADLKMTLRYAHLAPEQTSRAVALLTPRG